MARANEDWAEFQRLTAALHKRHPKSPLIRADLALVATLHLRGQLPQEIDVAGVLETLAPNPKETLAQQVVSLSAKSEILMTQGRPEEAIKAGKEAIAIAPADYTPGQMTVALMLAKEGRFAEAEEVARELYTHSSDCLDVVRLLGGLVAQQGKPDKEPNTRERFRELIAIYGIR